MKEIISGLFGGLFGSFVSGYVVYRLQVAIKSAQANAGVDLLKLTELMSASQKQSAMSLIGAVKLAFPGAKGDITLALNALAVKYPELAPLIPALTSLLLTVEQDLAADLSK